MGTGSSRRSRNCAIRSGRWSSRKAELVNVVLTVSKPATISPPASERSSSRVITSSPCSNAFTSVPSTVLPGCLRSCSTKGKRDRSGHHGISPLAELEFIFAWYTEHFANHSHRCLKGIVFKQVRRGSRLLHGIHEGIGQLNHTRSQFIGFYTRKAMSSKRPMHVVFNPPMRGEMREAATRCRVAPENV